MSGSPTLPRPFGRYVLTNLVGEGGMAEIYRASVRVAEGLTKWVVIKKIREEFANQPEFTRMFVDEAKVALSLNHANIVQVFDFGQVDGAFYLAMELIDGIDVMQLFRVVRSNGDAIPAVMAAYIGHQVASGLAYAHRKTDDFGKPLGIVHRDVSPHNIMLSFDGQVRVLDFGIARTRAAETAKGATAARRSAETETIKGKVAYMSPEQARGMVVDQRSDLYSLGVVLYELLCGELLYRDVGRLEALDLVRSRRLPALLERAPDLPDELARVVDRALEHDPNARYQSAREIQADLAAYLHRSDPIVDDEFMAEYVGRYRELGAGRDAPRDLSQIATRDVGTGPSGSVELRGKQRFHRRVVLLRAAFAPTGTFDASRADRFNDFLRDVAFKREALLVRLDGVGALMAFGAVLRTRDVGERAIRVALTLREVVGEQAPGLGLGLCLVDTHVVVNRGLDGLATLELPDGLDAVLGEVAHQAIDAEVKVAGRLATDLDRIWRFGQPQVLPQNLSSDASAGTPWAAELAEIVPLLGPKSQAERRHDARPRLYGRELELKALHDALRHTIRHGRARSVLVIGEPGMGKRSLVSTFLNQVDPGTYTVLRGAGQWSRRNQPFSVLLEIMGRFLRIRPESTRAEIERKLADYGVADARMLAHVLLRAHGDPGALTDGDPEERKDLLQTLSRRLVRALAARRPLVILIENLQVLDAESLRLIESWARNNPDLPVLGISTSRPGPRAQALRRQKSISTIELRELDEQARRRLILDRFERPEEAQELCDAILARTGGHPLFIEELLANLHHHGVVGWNEQARHLVVRDSSSEIELPPSIEAALHARIDELDPQGKEAVFGASILGRRFRVTEVRALVPDLQQATLDHLAEDGLFEVDEDPDGSEHEALRFSTLSLYEVCKASVPAPSARELHAKAAKVKLARDDYHPGRDDGPIAEHLAAAGRLEEAVEPAISAARNAMGIAGNVEAYYFLTQALRGLSPGQPQRFEVILMREPILQGWGRRRAQGADIRQLLREAELLGDPEKQVLASVRLLRFYIDCGRINRANKLLPRLDARVQALRDPGPFRAVLGELRSELMLARGLLDDAELAAREALPHCWEDERGVRQRTRLLTLIGRVELITGRYDQGADTFHETLRLARSIQHRRLEAEALNNLGEVAGKQTNYEDAVRRFRASLAIDRDIGERHNSGIKFANLGITYTALGLYSRAERYLRRALEMHEAVGHAGLLNEAMVALGEVVHALGDCAAAQALLADASAVALQREDPRTDLRAQARLAAILADLEQYDQAIELAQSVADRARSLGLRTNVVRALHVLARVHVARGDLEQAEVFASDAVHQVEAGAAPVEGVLSLHLLGEITLSRGKSERGHDLIERARSIVRTRLENLQDPELKQAYCALPDVRHILGS